MKTVSTDRTEIQPWRTRSWRTVPFSPLFSVIFAITTICLALFVLKLANDSPVDSWLVAPTVYLSIIATLSNSLLRSAFRSSSDIFWWSKLLSDPGVSLKDLHTLWEVAYDVKGSLKFNREQNPQLHLRATSLAVLFLAANGPLLQRGVTVDSASQTLIRTKELPIRREPMWNLTQKMEIRPSSSNPSVLSQFQSGPMYQDEFDEVVTGFHQHRSLRLSGDSVCGQASVCSAKVVIAGFGRHCEQRKLSVREVPTLGSAFSWQGRECLWMGWNMTGNSTSLPKGLAEVAELMAPERLEQQMPCGWMETFYQFELAQNWLYGDDGRIEHSLGWAEGSPPYVMNYTNIVRPDHRSDDVLLTQCDFYSSFVEVPIQIVNGSTVTMATAQTSEDDITIKMVEPIPRVHRQNIGDDVHPEGLVEAMEDLYNGYLLFDTEHSYDAQRGSLPRRFINRSSLEQRPKYLSRGGSENSPTGFIYSMLNPLEDFTQSLHELSLRYAMVHIPETDERISEEQKFMKHIAKHMGDGRQRAIDAMKTTISKTQTVVLEETTIVAVYRSHYIYTIIALSLSVITSALIMMLLRDWGLLGRDFSMSPLEVAKAFDAPLLRDAGSNATGSEISKQVSDKKVRYGCVVDTDNLPVLEATTEPTAGVEAGIVATTVAENPSPSCTEIESVTEREGSAISDQGPESPPIVAGARLIIAKADEVESPRDNMNFS